MRDGKRTSGIRKQLDDIYARYHRREFVHPDPLEFLYRYDDPAEREIVGLIASSLAYGRVAQILKSVSVVLGRMGPPASFIGDSSEKDMRRSVADFRHRFTTGEELADLLIGIKRVVEEHGSLKAAFVKGLRDDDETVLPALDAFATALMGTGCNSLIPLPGRGSACKRLNLFLRWMVRRDEVDPGGWDEVGPARLIVPLDTHQYRICTALGFTRRKSANLRTALEITEAFRRIAPEDPVRYDFSLTRTGILPGNGPESFRHEDHEGVRQAPSGRDKATGRPRQSEERRRRKRCTQ